MTTHDSDTVAAPQDAAAGLTGEERRQHPRHAVPDAPTRTDGEPTHRLADVSQSGLSFYCDRALPPGTPLTVALDAQRRVPAATIASQQTVFDTSYMDRSLRYRVRCKFDQVLEPAEFEDMLGALGRVAIALGA